VKKLSKIDYNSLPMEEFEKVAQYDLKCMVLNDCTYLSDKAVLDSVETWWKINGDFIIQACLEKIRRLEGTTQ